MSGIARIAALVKKELLTLLKDGKSRFIIVGPPIIQLIVFGYAASFDVDHVPMAVYNEDRGAAARELVADFTAAPAFTEVAQIRHQDQMVEVIDSREALLVLHIGQNFSQALTRGESGTVQAIIDGRNSNTALVVLNYVRNILNDFNRDWIARHDGDPPPARVIARAWYNPNLESRWFIVPGIVGLLTLVVTMVVMSMSVAREREQGTFDQLLVTPLGTFELLLGKVLPGFIIGIFEATLIITLAVFWFQVPLLGSLATLYLGLLLFLLSSVGVGLMISSLAVTQQQGLLGAFLFLVPAVILSGFATPIANMPQVVQWITYLDPLRYFIEILRAVFLKGESTGALLDQFWPMAVIGVVAMTMAAWMFRRRMY